MRNKFLVIVMASLISFTPKARADLFGGDVVVLTQILLQTIKQLYELKQIVSTGEDTLSLLRDINSGVRHGLNIIKIINPKFNPGIYGALDRVDQIQRAIEDLYGLIPLGSEYRLQLAQDLSASESIAMNGTLFRYADSVDEETKRIIAHAEAVSPQGAGKLTAQSIAVLIGVTTQLLRTNSMMLKMMGQNMALSNRKEKIQTQQFKTQYEGISSALGGTLKSVPLNSLGLSEGR